MLFRSYKQESFQSEEEIKVFKDKCAEVCNKAILDSASSISKRFSCCINSEHKISAEFIVMDLTTYANDELQKKRSRANKEKTKDSRKELIDVVQILEDNKYSLLIEKIGQYPSMADIQMFDIEKYRPVLKGNFRDFSMAIGLKSAGVGCGSFVYLRRIFENLVEDEHAKVSEEQKWDDKQEKEYSDKHFDEKIAYLEKQGRSIIPDDVSELKTKLYGVLSKGIHYSSDELCIELFPYMKW